jgi:hypothetical protein
MTGRQNQKKTILKSKTTMREISDYIIITSLVCGRGEAFALLLLAKFHIHHTKNPKV